MIYSFVKTANVSLMTKYATWLIIVEIVQMSQSALTTLSAINLACTFQSPRNVITLFTVPTFQTNAMKLVDKKSLTAVSLSLLVGPLAC